MNAPVHDRLNRPLEALRISVTDRCNLRCTYCMPKALFARHVFLGNDELLSFDEIEMLAKVFTRLGVRKIRLTGGEPLLRPDLDHLVRRLVALPGLDELALSTNGLLLRAQARALREAGLTRVNLSLDALDNRIAGEINGMGKPADLILDGIESALEHGFLIKVNMVVQRGVNDTEILPMARRLAAWRVPLRFIEYMDVGNCNGWKPEQVVPGREILNVLRTEYDLEPVNDGDPADTARQFRCARTGARFGFVNSVTTPFCHDCNRLRLSANGRLFTCLFAREGFDLATSLRAGASAAELAATVRTLWQGREDRYSELRAVQNAAREAPKIEMSFIGG